MPSDRSTRVLVVLCPDVHLQDLAGPVQVFHEAAQLGGAYRLLHVSHRRRVRSAQGLELSALARLPAPRAGDLVLVPGTDSAKLDRLDAPREWLCEAHAAGARIASVCSGAFALARAGLLDGRRCTTHWKVIDRLRAEHPEAHVLDDRLFVEDGSIVTSAGVASGIDMALALVEKDYGPLVAARVAREMVVYIRRDGDRGQATVYLDHRNHLHPGVHRVQDWLVTHPEAKPSLAGLARLAAMSPRNLTRIFRRSTGISPKQFALRVKAQVARDLLGDPQRTIEGIGASCGFEDARQLRRLWRQSFGVSIAAYRAGQQPDKDGP
jgi:transcriptional regulator GlxA family with amidase domain